MSTGAYYWEASTGERVFSSIPLAARFPDQGRVFADINDIANNIEILPGWATSDL